MAKNKHMLLWIAAGVGGAYVAYRFVYKPWVDARDAADQGTHTPGNPLFPATTPPITYQPGAPAPFVPPSTSPAVTPSTSGGAPSVPLVTAGPATSLGPQYGGAVGACIAKKGGTWSPEKCQTRLNDLLAAAANAKTALAQFDAVDAKAARRSAGIPEAQGLLAANQAALAQATNAYNAALAANDASAQVWYAAMVGHQNDIANLTAAIASAQQPEDTSAARSAYEAQLSANDNDFFALTGQHLIGLI